MSSSSSSSTNLAKDILGYSAAVSLIITLFPQIYHTWKSRKADDISYGFLSLQVLTCVLFLSYGILLKESPLIIANSLVLTQSFTLWMLKCSFSGNKTNIITHSEPISLSTSIII